MNITRFCRHVHMQPKPDSAQKCITPSFQRGICIRCIRLWELSPRRGPGAVQGEKLCQTLRPRDGKRPCMRYLAMKVLRHSRTTWESARHTIWNSGAVVPQKRRAGSRESRFKKSPKPEDDQIGAYHRLAPSCSRRLRKSARKDVSAARERTSVQEQE